MKVAPEHGQSAQRVKVGMIGLAAVILLIGLASAIFSLVTRERTTGATGAAKGEVVANLAVAENITVDGGNEPLADLGVAPGAAPTGNSATP